MDLHAPKRRHRLREIQLQERSHCPSIILHNQQGSSRIADVCEEDCGEGGVGQGDMGLFGVCTAKGVGMCD